MEEIVATTQFQRMPKAKQGKDKREIQTSLYLQEKLIREPC